MVQVAETALRERGNRDFKGMADGEGWDGVIDETAERDYGEDTDDSEGDRTNEDETYEPEDGELDDDEVHEPEVGEINAEEMTETEVSSSKDRRRYFCQYCGIGRSKKYLIDSHILNEHEDEIEEAEDDDKINGKQLNTCKDCGASFRKPAYLKQHMQSHSLERPYICPVDDCSVSYRRKDHLTRHLLRHKGKLFTCPAESCGRKFSYQASMKKHLDEIHSDDLPSTTAKDQKQYICKEVGCGKVFTYASKLQTHQESHVKFASVEVLCAEPGCMTYFTNEKCLREHIKSCHLYINCEICGKKHLKKNIKRHLRTHDEESPPKIIKCNHSGCSHTFSTDGNLRQHIKAVHLSIKPFVCHFADCGMSFAYKHVRDKHEKTGRHVYSTGDFVAADEQFRSRPRGGRKRKYPPVEMLVRKRVSPPSELDFMFNKETE